MAGWKTVEGVQLCRWLDCSPVRPVLDVRLMAIKIILLCCFKPCKFVVIYPRSSQKASTDPAGRGFSFPGAAPTVSQQRAAATDKQNQAPRSAAGSRSGPVTTRWEGCSEAAEGL